MKFPNFCGPFYESQSANETVDELLNLFVEQVEVGGKNQYVLYKRPGYVLFASPAVLTILACPSENPEIDTPYSFFMSASGGTPPYTWSLVDGAFPDGISIDAATGEISGTTSEGGLFEFTIRVTDLEENTADITCSFIISVAIISGCPSEQPVFGEFYSFTLEASGGTLPYVWSLVDGAFPDGITLDPDTGEISGTTEETGTFDWTVQVEDDNGLTDQLACQFVIEEVATAFRFLNQEAYEDDPPVNPSRSGIDDPEFVIDDDAPVGESTTYNDQVFKSGTVASYPAPQWIWGVPEPLFDIASATIDVRFGAWDSIAQVGGGPVIRIDVHNARNYYQYGEAGYLTTLVGSLLSPASYPLTDDIDDQTGTITFTEAELISNFGADWWNNIYLAIWLTAGGALVSPYAVTNVNIDKVVTSGDDAIYYWSGRTGPYPQPTTHVTISGCTNTGNNGTFKVADSFSSPDRFVVENPDAVDEDPSPGVAVTDPWWHIFTRDSWIEYNQ